MTDDVTVAMAVIGPRGEVLSEQWVRVADYDVASATEEAAADLVADFLNSQNKGHQH